MANSVDPDQTIILSKTLVYEILGHLTYSKSEHWATHYIQI